MTLADEYDASRPTVYRRLNRLEAVGLVDSAMTYDAHGHHRTVFEAIMQSLSIEVKAEGSRCQEPPANGTTHLTDPLPWSSLPDRSRLNAMNTVLVVFQVPKHGTLLKQ